MTGLFFEEAYYCINECHTAYLVFKQHKISKTNDNLELVKKNHKAKRKVTTVYSCIQLTAQIINSASERLILGQESKCQCKKFLRNGNYSLSREAYE